VLDDTILGILLIDPQKKSLTGTRSYEQDQNPKGLVSNDKRANELRKRRPGKTESRNVWTSGFLFLSIATVIKYSIFKYHQNK